jgi:hypothetical protein
MTRKEALIKKRQWLCMIGFHSWQQDDGIMSPFPIAFERLATRECCHCGFREQWLPGFGGSELGCWIAQERDQCH